MSRYYNKVTKTEAIEGIHDLNPPAVVVLPLSNVFWDPLPAGMQLTYDIDLIPNGLEPIPAIVYTAEEQARIDLDAANVTAHKLSAAIYADNRGNPARLAAIDVDVDAIVLANGLSLDTVISLI